MNGRPLILILAIALFVHIWTSAQQPVTAEQMTAAPLPMPCAVAASTALRSESREKSDCQESSTRWIGPALPVTPPAELASGSYRVVDNTGAVGQVELSNTVQRGSAKIATVEKSVDNVSQTWIFMRLTSQPVAAKGVLERK